MIYFVNIFIEKKDRIIRKLNEKKIKEKKENQKHRIFDNQINLIQFERKSPQR